MLETGMLFGVGFGLFVGLFLRFGAVPRVNDLELAPDEVVRHVGGANHFQNREGRGGTLVLTNQALVFMPHIVNFQHNEARIPLFDIVEVDAIRTLGIIPNGLSITIKLGNQERFAVNHRRGWLALLRNN
jgi:hypothetical protein